MILFLADFGRRLCRAPWRYSGDVLSIEEWERHGTTSSSLFDLPVE